MFLKIIKELIKNRKEKNLKTLDLIIFFVSLIFLIPVISSILPFTYIGL